MTQARNTLAVVEVTSVPNAGGADLVTRFSTRPFTDRSAGWVAVASLLEEPTLQMDRTQGKKLRGESVPRSSTIRAGLPVTIRQALGSRNCERQTLRWWRVGRETETLTGVDPTFTGIASGWDMDDVEVVVQAFATEKLFEAPVQPNKLEGRGTELFFVQGGVELLMPSMPVTTSVTVEVGFTRDTLLTVNELPLISRGELNGADDEWAIFIHGLDAKLEAHYKPTGASAIDLESSLVTVSGTRYHAAMQWDGTDVKLGWDGSWDVTSATSTKPFDGGGSVWLGLLVEGVTTHYYGGAIDFCRIWVDDAPTWAEMTAWQNRQVPSSRQGGVTLELLLNEGQWNVAEDPQRARLTEAFGGSVEWQSSNTGDPELRGKREPWCLGYVPSAPALLIDKIFQVYQVATEIETGIPRSGGRRMQERLTWSSLTLTFDQASRTIKDHRSGNAEWADLLAGATIRITGSALNDADYILARDAYQDGDFYFVELLEAPETEASVVVTTIETVIGAPVTVVATGTVDFDSDDMTITAKSGQSFAEFSRGEKLTVSGSTSNDGDDVFTLYAAPYIVSGEWVMVVAPGPTDGTGDTGVTIEQVDTRGEYTLTESEGRFELPFLPTKTVTFEAYGEPGAGGSTPLTAADQIKWLLDNGSTDIQAIPYSAGRLATMARKFPALSGIAQGSGEVLNFAQALRVLGNTMGAHYWISPRTGTFEVLDWPFVARNPVPIDQSALDSNGATGDVVDLQDDPDSGTATASGVVLTNPAAVSWVTVEVDQVERPYVDTFVVRVATKGSKSTVTMVVAAFEALTPKKLFDPVEVGTSEEVFEFTLDTADLTDDSGGNNLAIGVQNSETDGSTLTVGAIELVPTWKVTEIGPEDVFELDSEPSVPGAGAVEVHYSLNKVRLSAGDLALPVLANRSAAGREALERVTSDFLVDSYPGVLDDAADLAVLETSQVSGDDAVELAEAIFAGAGTNTWFGLRVASALLEDVDPFFRVVRFSSAWPGVLEGVTDDAYVVTYDEGELEAQLSLVFVGRVL